MDFSWKLYGSNLTIKNEIIYNNTSVFTYSGGNPSDCIAYGGGYNLVYSLTNGGFWNSNPSGTNNINANPLFVDSGSGDFNLQSTSPCIDAGDPSSELDPDGTIADIGAYYFYQEPDVEGCTNPDASNYDETANADDGSCCIELWGECYNIEETTELSLYSAELTGEIPSSIENLTNLTNLNLSNNQLTGEIPSSIGNLTNLTSLSLYGNQLTGEIPSSIGNLTNLTSLILMDNLLTGEIPSTIGNLINLTDLLFCFNQLAGEIPPSIGNLINLDRLMLNSNQLTGEIPSEIGNLVNLVLLFTSNNQLTGDIPHEIGNMTSLEEWWGSNCQLTSIPNSIENLSELIFFSSIIIISLVKCLHIYLIT